GVSKQSLGTRISNTMRFSTEQVKVLFPRHLSSPHSKEIERVERLTVRGTSRQCHSKPDVDNPSFGFPEGGRMTHLAAGTGMDYRIVIGLEVHVQLLTQTKLFCGCSTQFGLPPNTATCPICIGLPGVLPVMNGRAFDLALKAALALNCKIAAFTKWDRK